MSKKFIIISLACIVLIGGFLRFYKLGDSAFDRDEFFELNSSYGYFKTGDFVTWDFGSQKPFPADMQDTTSTDRAEVFRWQIAQLYHFFDPSEALTRGVGSFWGIIGILLVYFIVFSFTRNVYIALIAAFLTAIGGSEVIYSRRLRMYSMFFPVYLAFSWTVFQFYEKKYKGKIKLLKNFYEKTGFNFAYFLPVLAIGLISLNVHVLSAHIAPVIAVYSVFLLFLALYKKELNFKNIFLNKYFLTTLATIVGLIIYNLPILNSLHKLIKKNFKFFLAKPHYDFFNQYFSDFLFPIIGLILFLVGTLYLARKMNRAKESFFLFCSAMIPLLFAIFTWKRDVSQRYIYFIQSFAVILIAIGFYGIVEIILSQAKKYKKVILAILILIFLVNINFNYIYSREKEVFVRKPNSYYPNFNKVFDYVIANKKPTDVMITRAYRSFYWKDQYIKVYDTKSLDFGSKDCADKINIIFEDFLKNSAKNYEKATILIGKEFEVINLIFKNMAQELNPLLAQNLENNKKKEKLKLLLEKFKNISEIQLTENQINKSVLSLELEKNNEQEEINKKEQEKQKLVNSKTYQEHKKEKEQIEEEKLDIKREIQDIKTKINLKELAKVYHGHEKKHKVIQRYMDNFDQAINEGNKELDNILKERVLNFSLSAVAERKKKLEEHTNSSELAEKKLEKEIESKSIGLGEIDKKIEEEKVKLTKFSERREALVSEVKKEASEIFS